MTTELRRFTEEGIEEFRNYLHVLKNNEEGVELEDLIKDRNLYEIVNFKIKVDKKIFSTREDIVKYISDKLLPITDKNILFDGGLWTWLSAFFFDSICPINKNGVRIVGEDARYILNPEEWKRYYRHLLASPVRLYRDLGTLSKIYLAGTPDKPGDLFEQLASRQEIAASKGIIEAATILYWDEMKGKIKKGARNKEGPGILRRFVDPTIPQFQMTYDLNAMSGNDVIQLLPDEYGKWINS
jgi:hypothetical protein